MDFLVYLLFLWVKLWAKIIPLSFARWLAKIYGILFYYFMPIRKKVALSNLKLCFPDKTIDEFNRILKGAYINLITVFIEIFYMNRFKEDDFRTQLILPNPGIVREKLKLGKGLIVLTAHFGNWEWLAYGGALLCGESFNIIVKQLSNIRLNNAFMKIRSSKGNKMVDMKHSLRESLSLLRSNKIVALIGDQSPPPESSVKSDFFIKDVPTYGGTAALAIKTGCPLIFAVIMRNNNGTYDISYQEINTEKYKIYNDENIKALTQEHVNLLKEVIIKRPEHWLWFHKRFKHVV